MFGFVIKFWAFFLQQRRPGQDKRFRTIGESIILGAAAVATAGDKNAPQLVRNTNRNTNKPQTHIFTNYFENHNGQNDGNSQQIGLAECLEDSLNSSLKSLATNQRKKFRFNPSFWLSQKFKSRAKRIDVMARIIFPMVFAVFNISYWTFYLLQSRN